MRRTPFATVLLLALALTSCELVVPAPGTSMAPLPPPGTPAALPGGGLFAEPPSSAPNDSPGVPVLLRKLPSLELPDGARIVTRGQILNDRAALNDRKGFINDPVLDDPKGSIRLVVSPLVLDAVGKGPRIVTGILGSRGKARTLTVERIDPVPETIIANLTVDQRPREPNEVLTITPGPHAVTVEAPGLAAIEFVIDPESGPSTVLTRDSDPRDGFTASWSAVPNDELQLSIVGFTLFDEQIDGPSMRVKVGPTIE